MNRRNFIKKCLAALCVPFLVPKKTMRVAIIKTHDEGEFWCEAKAEPINDFLTNYRTRNEARLRRLGYKDLIPEIRIEEMTQEKYHTSVVSVESARYFNGIGV